MPSPSDAERACLARLTKMDEALARMQGELPDDVQSLGQIARDQVRAWQKKLAEGGSDLEALSKAMREISSLMDALAARFLLKPWHRPPDRSRMN